MVSALGAFWGSLGTFLAHLVGLWVALGASLGASWDLLGLLGRLLVPLGVCLGPCWGLLVALGASLGVSRDLLDLLGCLLVGLFVTLLESLGGSWRLLGNFLGLAWPIFWAFWGIGVGGAFRCGAGSCRPVTLWGVLGWGWEIGVGGAFRCGAGLVGRLHSS